VWYVFSRPRPTRTRYRGYVTMHSQDELMFTAEELLAGDADPADKNDD